MSDKIDVDKVIKHWMDTSDEDFQTMLSLYNSKSYGWALFMGHLTIEKLLKAIMNKQITQKSTVKTILK